MQGSLLAGRYKLVTQLGEGGMGSVWRAEHLALHTQVAVKLIDPKFAKSPQARIRFEREAQAAAELRSTHIVQILDYGIADGTPFIVMELLEGEDLAARLERVGKLTAREALHILAQVARALGRAHQRDIVHRDLKPDNIFIVREDSEEVVKVLDFGIAKVNALSQSTDAKTHTGMLLGSPFYMSPEQAHGYTDIDSRADIWAFGVIACECITGRRPFEHDTLTALLMAICHGPIARPSDLGEVPPGFDGWFARAVTRERAERFSSIVEAATQLRDICDPSAQGSQHVSSVPNPPSLERTEPLPTNPPVPVGTQLVDTANPASRTIQIHPAAQAKARGRLWLIAALTVLALVGFAVRTWVTSTPSVASAAGQNTTLRESPSAAPEVGSSASAAIEPSASPLALSSTNELPSAASSLPEAAPTKPVKYRATKKGPEIRAPQKEPDAPAPSQRSRVQNTSNAAGF